MGIKITGTGTINGHKQIGLCPQCQKSNILPNKSGLYSVGGMFPAETGRCTECGYVEFETGEGNPNDPVHGGCRAGCRTKHRVSLPITRDRADGVKGHFCVGRYVDGFSMQYWSIKLEDWSSTADRVLTENKADVIVALLTALLRKEKRDAAQA
jgi:hypothetical protein